MLAIDLDRLLAIVQEDLAIAQPHSLEERQLCTIRSDLLQAIWRKIVHQSPARRSALIDPQVLAQVKESYATVLTQRNMLRSAAQVQRSDGTLIPVASDPVPIAEQDSLFC